MDNVKPINEFLAPLHASWTNNELERAMVEVFTAVAQKHHLAAWQDIYNYGTPWQGSNKVVERFTKLNGLAVLRRDDNGFSDKLMSIIYANWAALASERGLAFLQFVLDMLYPSQNKIVRLWHPIAKSSSYPRLVREAEGSNNFLTSRVRIKIDSDVDISELAELAPTISRLVPWNIVPEISVSVDTQDISIALSLAGQIDAIANYSPY